jgi:hypothetical protein
VEIAASLISTRLQEIISSGPTFATVAATPLPTKREQRTLSQATAAILGMWD